MSQSAFGEVLGHPTKPRLRFFMAGEGEGGGAGGTEGKGGGEEEKGVDAATAKALREQADKRMQERNSARDEAKKWTELGLTLDEVAELKAARDTAKGGPTPEQVAKDAQRAAEKAAGERFASVARTSAVKSQAAVLGFHDPADALALLDQSKLADVTVDADTYEADPKAVTALLEALATAKPHLVKPKTPETADWRTAGIGGTGSSTPPDPGPGTPRLAAAYAASRSGGRK